MSPNMVDPAIRAALIVLEPLLAESKCTAERGESLVSQAVAAAFNADVIPSAAVIVAAESLTNHLRTNENINLLLQCGDYSILILDALVDALRALGFTVES